MFLLRLYTYTYKIIIFDVINNTNLLANVPSATLPIKAELYETATRLAEEAIANWRTASITRIASKADAQAAAIPAIHTAAKNKIR